MAKRPDTHVVRTYRTVARASLGLFVPPMILIPAVVWAYAYWRQHLIDQGVESPHIGWALAPIGFLLLFPLWAKFKSLTFDRYLVTLDSVVEEHGVFGKNTSEIRIQDIRNIVVRQSFLDRILLFGDVSFSSAAGTDVEVTFPNVPRPTRIKELVRDIQSRLSDGELDDADVQAIHERALGARAVQREREREAAKERAAEEKAKAKAARAEEKAAAKVERAKERAAEEGAASERAEATEGARNGAGESGESSQATTVESAGPATTRASVPAPSPRPSTRAADAGGDAENAGDELYRLLAEQARAGKSEE